MKFRVFDHMDPTGPALGRRFEDRLRLVDLYERAGFHAYHLAEHHATPLGMAPRPVSPRRRGAAHLTAALCTAGLHGKFSSRD
jgi:alkanesulfonate monooxygenase SsuD/methylene tetrahydromethanopterin reductase-like flavin-dependent oxidoreductase (luciferase family)